MRLLACVPVLVCLVGCTLSRWETIKERELRLTREVLLARAAKDLSCPKSELEGIEALEPTPFQRVRVRGCGSEERYTFCRNSAISSRELRELNGTFSDASPYGTPVLLFDEDWMTEPEKVSGASMQYPPEALDARVQGLIVVSCVVTVEGNTESCRVVQGLPSLDDAALAAVRTWRVKPAELEGKPVSVRYPFIICSRIVVTL